MFPSVLAFLLRGFAAPLALSIGTRAVALPFIAVIAGALVLLIAGPRRKPIAWRSPWLWASTGALLGRDAFLALAGGRLDLSFLYAPLAVALIGEVFGWSGRKAMRLPRWIAMTIAFGGAGLAMRGQAGFSFYGLASTLCFALIPILTERLERTGMSSLEVLRGQCFAGSVLAVPVLAGLGARGQLALPLAATTLVPAGMLVSAWLWYRAIRAQGAARTAVAAYAEPAAAALGFALLYSQPSFSVATATGVLVAALGILLGACQSGELARRPQKVRKAGGRAAQLWVQVVHLPAMLLGMAWLFAEPTALLETWHFHLLGALGFVAAWMRWRSERGARPVVLAYVFGFWLESVWMCATLFGPLGGMRWLALGVMTAIELAPIAIGFRGARHEPRHPVELDACLILSGSGLAVDVEVVDLSISGCRLRIGQTIYPIVPDLAAGSAVTVRLEVTEGPISIPARIAHTSRVGRHAVLGLRFDRAQAELLTRLLAARASGIWRAG